MPELPEVETIRRGLAQRIIGRRITSVDLRLAKLFRLGDAATLAGWTVTDVRRHAKFLAIDFDSEWTLIVHLNLAGQIVLEAADGSRFSGGHPVPAFHVPLPHKSTRFILTFDDGSTLYLTDIRTFGHAHLLPTPAAAEWLASQERGPDALLAPISAEDFLERLHRRRGVVLKALLLDQRFLAGIGNIYADESLHGAGLSPTALAGSVDAPAASRLLSSIRNVLNEAVTNGVAEVLNGKATPGASLPRVHGRRGEPCPVCGTPIERIVVAQRSTYFCPQCQQPTS